MQLGVTMGSYDRSPLDPARAPRSRWQEERDNMVRGSIRMTEDGIISEGLS